jgi:hypothetical protein
LGTKKPRTRRTGAGLLRARRKEKADVTTLADGAFAGRGRRTPRDRSGTAVGPQQDFPRLPATVRTVTVTWAFIAQPSELPAINAQERSSASRRSTPSERLKAQVNGSVARLGPRWVRSRFHRRVQAVRDAVQVVIEQIRVHVQRHRRFSVPPHRGVPYFRAASRRPGNSCEREGLGC